MNLQVLLVVRYAILVVCDATPVVCYVNRVVRSVGNLLLSSTVNGI